MKRFSLIAALLLVSLLGSFVTAATVTVAGTFSAPTTYTDSSPLPAADIVGYDIDCVFTPTGGTAAACAFSPTTTVGNATSFSVQLTYAAGTGGRACFRTRTRTALAVSAFSPLAANGTSCKDFVALTPGAPGAVTVTVTVTVVTP